MSELKDIVPTEFYNEQEAGIPPPRVETVGDLIKQLQRLPESLLVSGWPERETMEVTVCNISLDNPFLCINDVDVDDY